MESFINLALWLSLIASTIHLVGYWLYNRLIFKGLIKPNRWTWLLWATGSFIELWSYESVARDFIKDFLPAACVLATIVTFLFVLRSGHWKRPERDDVITIVVDVCIVAWYLVSGNAYLTHILLCLDILISFRPLLRECWENPDSEDAVPWIVWSFGYAFMIAVVLLRFEDGWALIYPATYLIMCVITAVVIKKAKSRRSVVA